MPIVVLQVEQCPPDNQPPEDPDDHDKNNQVGSSGNDGASANANNNSKVPIDTAEKTSSIPQEADDMLEYPEQKGSPPRGYKEKNFRNDPLQGAKKLPEVDKNGDPITYQEWDIDLMPPKNTDGRSSRRIVTGRDKSSYYTNDHYHTFNKIRDHSLK